METTGIILITFYIIITTALIGYAAIVTRRCSETMISHVLSQIPYSEQDYSMAKYRSIIEELKARIKSLEFDNSYWKELDIKTKEEINDKYEKIFQLNKDANNLRVELGAAEEQIKILSDRLFEPTKRSFTFICKDGTKYGPFEGRVYKNVNKKSKK